MFQMVFVDAIPTTVVPSPGDGRWANDGPTMGQRWCSMTFVALLHCFRVVVGAVFVPSLFVLWRCLHSTSMVDLGKDEERWKMDDAQRTMDEHFG